MSSSSHPLEHDLMFCDGTAELRWRSAVMDDKWLPPARAGHSAVTLPLKTKRTPCSVIFGGYNGHECFNDVVVFDCGKRFCIFQVTFVLVESSRNSQTK